MAEHLIPDIASLQDLTLAAALQARIDGKTKPLGALARCSLPSGPCPSLDIRETCDAPECLFCEARKFTKQLP